MSCAAHQQGRTAIRDECAHFGAAPFQRTNCRLEEARILGGTIRAALVGEQHLSATARSSGLRTIDSKLTLASEPSRGNKFVSCILVARCNTRQFSRACCVDLPLRGRRIMHRGVIAVAHFRFDDERALPREYGSKAHSGAVCRCRTGAAVQYQALSSAESQRLAWSSSGITREGERVNSRCRTRPRRGQIWSVLASVSRK